MLLLGKKLYKTSEYHISCKKCGNIELRLSIIDTNVVVGYCAACNIFHRYDLKKIKPMKVHKK